MRNKLHVKKGDTVVVLSGNSKGQKGRVLEIDYKKSRAVVEGVNLIAKHTKASSKHPNGGIIRKEGTIHISNLLHEDPKSGKPSRIGKRPNSTGKMIRYYKKSGEEVK
jgi:large subunit ribosomal protein L24